MRLSTRFARANKREWFIAGSGAIAKCCKAFVGGVLDGESCGQLARAGFDDPAAFTANP
jgi:hypothetical protein